MRIEARQIVNIFREKSKQTASSVVSSLRFGFQSLEVDFDQFILTPLDGDQKQARVKFYKQSEASIVIPRGDGQAEIPDSFVDTENYEETQIITLPTNQTFYFVSGPDNIYRITYLGQGQNLKGPAIGNFRIDSTQRLLTRVVEPQDVNLLAYIESRHPQGDFVRRGRS